MSVVSESVQWSPPYYNGGELLNYEDFQLRFFLFSYGQLTFKDKKL